MPKIVRNCLLINDLPKLRVISLRIYINFFHFKDVEEIEIEIKELKINLDRYNYFISDYSKEQIKLIVVF